MRTACLLLLCLLPSALIAQTASPAPKPPAAAPGGKPAAPKAAPEPAARPQTATSKPAAPPTAAAGVTPTLTTDDEKTIYALGLVLQETLAQFDLSAAELDIVKRALSDAAAGKPAVVLDDWGPKIDPLVRARRERVTIREKAAAETYLAKAATEAGAVKTTSGLVYRDITAGSGASPLASDRVRVHYRGTLLNDTEFDSSYARNEPMDFVLSDVVPCWTEGVQRMKVGGKARLVCPSNLAYGDKGSGPIPGGAALIFEIELLQILK